VNRKVITVLALTGILLIFCVWRISEPNTHTQKISPSSTAVTGLSVFDGMGVALGHGPLVRQKQPILSLDALKSADLFLSLSPRLAYSDREVGVLKEFVHSGGSVVVSFHDDTSSRNIVELLSHFDLPLSVREDPDFSNHQAIEVVADRLVGPIRVGMRVTFYSRHLFNLPECHGGSVSCYVSRWKVGSGQILVFAGYPPFVNGLITRSDNPELSARLRTRGERIVIDDYRHFFSDHTFGDLFMEPSFAVPISGVLFAALTFLLFGRFSTEDIEHPESEIASHGSLHLFQEQVLKGLLRSVDWRSRLEQQFLYIERLFPEGKEETEEARRAITAGTPETAASVCRLHREFLRRRGVNMPAKVFS
jgi:hypothetical protein